MGTGHTKETHKVIREGQKENLDMYHHPEEKAKHLFRLSKIECKIFPPNGKRVLEVFGGQGNLSKWYIENNPHTLISLTKETTGNSFDYIYKLRADKKKFDWIDIDSYGYPDKFFPVVFELMSSDCVLVFTFPIVGVNCLNGITEQHFYTFYRGIPTIGDVVGQVTDWGLREWILPKLVDVEKIKRIYRFVFKCTRVKATEMCNVRNR